MKIPSEETPENHTNGDGYISDDYEQLEMAPAPIRDGDFSEYMWMENEEEFNSQVLRELEEQELMEECMAAMLSDTAPNAKLSVSSNGVRINSSDSVNNSYSQSSSNTPSHYSAQSRLDRYRSLDNNHSNSSNSAPENGSKSTLNPDAKEFVPSSSRAATTMSNAEDEKVPS